MLQKHGNACSTGKRPGIQTRVTELELSPASAACSSSFDVLNAFKGCLIVLELRWGSRLHSDCSAHGCAVKFEAARSNEAEESVL